MKKNMIKLAVIIGILLLVFVSVNVWAEEEEKPSVSADIAVLSKYVWRGYEFSKNSAVIQPSMTIGYKGAGLNLWGNLDTNAYQATNSESFNETDMTLSYDKSFGMVGLGVGYIYYALDGIADSQELYLSVSLDTLLSPSLKVYREIAHESAWYASLGISHSFKLPKEITLDLAGSVGYYSYDNTDTYAEVDENLTITTNKYSSMHDGLVSVGLTIPVGKYFTVVPMVAYSFPLTSDAENLIRYTNAYSNDSDYIFGGVTLSMAF
ncbi:MAG: hypothetical protein WC560_13015 [Syntrophales bacterium]